MRWIARDIRMTPHNSSRNHYWRTSCRVCGGTDLYRFLDLGKTPLADAFLSEDQLRNGRELYFPLSIHVCKTCFHIQILDVVNPRLLFPEEYALFSSASPALVKHFKAYADDIHARFGNNKNSFAVEIASNDGALPAPLKDLGFTVLGVEPAVNTAQVARSRGIEVVTEFFSETFSHTLSAQYGRAGIVLANNVLAHVDEPLDFMRGIKNILDPRGVVIFEVQYGGDLIKHTELDNIYHEHLSFFTVRPLQILMEKCGMKIFDITTNAMQGGSLRCYATHVENNEHPTTETVAQMEQAEIQEGLAKLQTYDDFGKRALAIKTELRKIISDIKKSGKKIVGYGAPAKGNTLLNFCSIGSDAIDYCIERTQFKFNKFTPGMHIPVVSDEIIKKDGPPDFYLLLIWNYLDSVLGREKEYRADGGKFIVPIPNVRVL